ncbi:DNA-directed RNA polymerase III subunit RPC8 [Pancytospora philotis]|nr:DNA-directed RNA polymerase III subunit RPC8 [Pancytospora philotis]
MFVITELEDLVEIRTAAADKQQAVLEQLRRKYCGRLTEELGLGLALHAVVSIGEYRIRGSALATTVVFQALFYRFYADEVRVGKILSQSEDGITIGDANFQHYEVQSCDLLENSEFEATGARSCWAWNYRDSKLYYYTGDTVRFRIKKLCFAGFTVAAVMNEQGLGPCHWWD